MKDNDFINVLGYKVYKNKLLDALKYIDKFDKVHIISGNQKCYTQDFIIRNY